MNEIALTVAHLRDQERRRLGRLLEERLGGSLGLLLAQTNVFRAALAQSAAQRQAFDTLSGLTARALATLQDLAADLSLDALDDLGLRGALEMLALRIERRYGLSITLDPVQDGLAVPPSLAPAVYRIAQEALDNAGRHAGAGRVGLSLRVRHDELWLVVADDGEGFQPPEPLDALASEAKYGLAEMVERAAALGGTLDVSSVPGVGTQVRAQLPLDLPPRDQRASPGPGDPDALQLDPLTPRERDVLGGVAAGQTNKQIAARLQISDRTVQFHLSNVLSKLGVASRTEAAVLALERGLV